MDHTVFHKWLIKQTTNVLDQSVRDCVFGLVAGIRITVVVSVSISITSLSLFRGKTYLVWVLHWLPVVRSASSRCSVCKFPFSPREIWPSTDYHLTCSPWCKPLSHTHVYHYPGGDCYLKGHVTLDCKSSECQDFQTEGTLGILFVPTTRVFPAKVCHRNCTKK